MSIVIRTKPECSNSYIKTLFLDAPSPAKLRYSPSKVIKRASVTLDCTVDNPGRPENISYVWYRGSYQVSDHTTSRWTITPVTLETKSNFTCIAVNEGGQSQPATVYIDVYGKEVLLLFLFYFFFV